MAEIFDASGMSGATSGGAQALADALERLASPLEEIKKNTAAWPRMGERGRGDPRHNPTLDEFFGNLAGGGGKSNESAVKPFITVAKQLEDASKNLSKSAMNMASLGRSSAFQNGMNMDLLGQHAASRRAAVTGSTPRAATQLLTPQTMANVTSSAAGPLSFLGRSAATLGPALATVSTAAAAVAGPLMAVAGAGAAAAAGLGAIVFTARHFTQAFDRSAVYAFDTAMRDLNAVIGSMLVPIMHESTRVVRAFANSLNYSASAIMPAVKDIAKSVGDVFIAFMPVVSSAAGIFGQLLVVTADWAKTISGFIVPQIRAFAVVISGWAVALKGFITGIFAPLGNFRTVLVSLGQNMGKLAVVVSALVFSFFNMQDAISAMEGNLRDSGQKDSTGLAAAQHARMVGISSLGNEILQRAFESTGRSGMDAEDTEEKRFRSEMLELVQQFKGKTFEQIIADAMYSALMRVTGAQAASDNLKSIGNTPGVQAGMAFGRAMLGPII